MHVESLERKAFIDAFINFTPGNNISPSPVVPGIQWHELNKAHFHIVLTRERGEVTDLIFIVTADDDCVDLYRLQTRSLGGCNSGEHSIENINSGHLPKHITLETIETNRDAIQSGS